MREIGAPATEREISKPPLTVEELDRLIGDRPIELFLNTRNALYRERDMKRSPPSRDEAIRLMVEYPNLLRRSLLVAGKEVVFGFDEARYRELAG